MPSDQARFKRSSKRPSFRLPFVADEELDSGERGVANVEGRGEIEDTAQALSCSAVGAAQLRRELLRAVTELPVLGVVRIGEAAVHQGAHEVQRHEDRKF